MTSREVSLSQAVELLAESGDLVSLSALSRYLKQHADAFPEKRAGKERIVNFELLREHRRLNLGTKAAPTSAKAATNRADEAAHNVRAQRQLRELELATRIGAVTPVDEVKDAAFVAIAAFRGAFALALNETADQIAALTVTEARLIRPALRSMEKIAFEAFVRALADRQLALPEAEPA